MHIPYEKYSGNEIINIGRCSDTSIAELAKMLKNIVGFKGKIIFDTSKPDGMPGRLLDSRKSKHLAGSQRQSSKRV